MVDMDPHQTTTETDADQNEQGFFESLFGTKQTEYRGGNNTATANDVPPVTTRLANAASETRRSLRVLGHKTADAIALCWYAFLFGVRAFSRLPRAMAMGAGAGLAAATRVYRFFRDTTFLGETGVLTIMFAGGCMVALAGLGLRYGVNELVGMSGGYSLYIRAFAGSLTGAFVTSALGEMF